MIKKIESGGDLPGILAVWDLGPIREISAMHAGSVYKIERQAGPPLVLKDIGKDGPGLRSRFSFENEVLRHLEGCGVPVAPPIDASGAGPLVEREGRLYTLSPFLAADDAWHSLDPEGLKRLDRACGAAIAKLDAALAAFPARGLEDRTWKTEFADDIRDRWIPDLRRNLSRAEWDEFSAFFPENGEGLRAALGKPLLQLIHRDCHQGNIVVDGERVTGFIDFDHLSLGPRMFDPAYFIVHMIGDDIVEPERAEEWFARFPELLRGFSGETSATSADEDSILPLMLGMFIMFAGWFFEIGKPELARAKLALLYWTRERGARIAELAAWALGGGKGGPVSDAAEYWDVLDAHRRPTGRIHRRGVAMAPGDFHLVILAWIIHPEGRILLTRRHPCKPWPLLWECTGGSVIAGEDSLAGALREVEEETGLRLLPGEGRIVLRRMGEDTHYDYWLFVQDVDIGSSRLQEGEVVDIKWVDRAEFLDIARKGGGVPSFAVFKDIMDGDAELKRMLR
jgi:8-oxo-dGTP diphosphatase